jgi:TolB-like protein/DNA-binding winged helix-turn-helix (wHTH) protein/Tfp pilus assembly protein PilF
MNAATPRRGLVRFGAFAVDLRSGELHKEGVKIKLQEQPFRLLALLLERAGEVVTRDELRQRLWPEDTFGAFDDGLNTAIKKLRDALGDSAEKPRLVETLPKYGYRFILPVTSIRPEPSSEFSTQGPDAVGQVLRHPLWRKVKSWSRSRNVLLFATGTVALLFVVYLVRPHVRPQAIPASGKIMLAVLPFENLGGDPGQEFFSDGMTEEMITNLGGLHPERLGVIARTSAMRFKHASISLQQVGQDLGVQYVLEGSVQRSGDRVRITAQLIQVSDQTHIWAQTYDRNLRDVFAIQTEVARAIADEISLKLPPEQRRPRGPSAVDPEAFAFYLNGRYFSHRGSDGIPRAVENFQRAIAKDPDYALAYSGLADAYTVQVLWGWESPQRVLERAKAAAQKALALNSSLAEAHASLANVKLYSWDFRGAEQEFRQALELNPSYANAHHWLSHCLVALGRMDESLAETNRALIFDPLDLSIQTHLGWHHYFAREYDQAIAPIHKALEGDASPRSRVGPHAILGAVYEQKGMYDEAIANFRDAVGQSGGIPVYIAQLAHAQAASGNRAEALRLLEELKRLPRDKYVPPEEIAAVYAALREKETAFEWLEQAYQIRSASLINLKVDPRFDPLRSDQRFSDLVRRLGLPE